MKILLKKMRDTCTGNWIFLIEVKKKKFKLPYSKFIIFKNIILYRIKFWINLSSLISTLYPVLNYLFTIVTTEIRSPFPAGTENDQKINLDSNINNSAPNTQPTTEDVITPSTSDKAAVLPASDWLKADEDAEEGEIVAVNLFGLSVMYCKI